MNLNEFQIYFKKDERLRIFRGNDYMGVWVIFVKIVWHFCEVFWANFDYAWNNESLPSHVKNWGNGKKIIFVFYRVLFFNTLEPQKRPKSRETRLLDKASKVGLDFDPYFVQNYGKNWKISESHGVSFYLQLWKKTYQSRKNRSLIQGQRQIEDWTSIQFFICFCQHLEKVSTFFAIYWNHKTETYSLILRFFKFVGALLGRRKYITKTKDVFFWSRVKKKIAF